MKILMYPGKSENDNNQYINLLRESLISDVEVVDFNFSKAIFGRYDILHIHWLDRLFRASTKSKTWIKRFLLFLLIIRSNLVETSIVWTVHNKMPHERLSTLENFIKSSFLKTVKSKVYLQDDPDFNASCDFIIPHGNYRNELASFNYKKKLDSSVVICVGFLRPSKNIERLISKFPHSEKFSLTISGEPISVDYGKHLCTVANGRKDFILEIERLKFEQLVKIYENSFCSIVPYLNIYNSGAAIFSLSFPRPVIATFSNTMRDLQEEVGSEWMQLIPQNFDSEDIALALENLTKSKGLRISQSPLSRKRDWNLIGRLHVEAYSEISFRKTI